MNMVVSTENFRARDEVIPGHQLALRPDVSKARVRSGAVLPHPRHWPTSLCAERTARL